MGGRRATSLNAVVGAAHSPALEHRLKVALRSADPEAIAATSAELTRRAIPLRQLDECLTHFTPFVRAKLERRVPLDDPRREVRAEWSRLKRQHDLHPSSVLSQAVEQAVIEFLSKRLRS